MLGTNRAAEKRSRYLLLFVTVLFAVGVVFGMFLVSALTAEQQQEVSDQLAGFLHSMAAGAAPAAEESFWSQMWLHGRWLLLLAVLGLSVAGFPFILALDFFKGMMIGFAIGTLAERYSWKGLVFSLLSVVPPNLLSVPAYLAVSSASISFAVYVIRNRFISRQGTLIKPAGKLVGTAAVMLLLAAAASAVEAWCSPLLMRHAAAWLLEGMNH